MVDLIKERGIINKLVLDAMLKIPRHLFVPKEFQDIAYEDRPLPIGQEQTISQPYTIAFMLDEVEIKKHDKVLEIGTGSGYNAALIQEIAKTKVYTTEIIPKLAKQAELNLKKAKIKNVKIILTDGSEGYKKASPYDKIIVTAASPKLPKHLNPQLKRNGIMIVPVGYTFSQYMIKARKVKNILESENLGSFMFVQLTGKHGY